jgi:hypothetical protein
MVPDFAFDESLRVKSSNSSVALRSLGVRQKQKIKQLVDLLMVLEKI